MGTGCSPASLLTNGVVRTVGPASVLWWYQWVGTATVLPASKVETDQSILLGLTAAAHQYSFFTYPKAGGVCLLLRPWAPEPGQSVIHNPHLVLVGI